MYIGLTGNIASGKSTVAEFFERHGVYTIDADNISKIVMAKEGSAYNEIINYFGTDILNNNKEINRAKLKEIVFNNSEKLKKLEEIVHPKILEYERKIVSNIKGRDSSAIIVSHAALMIEKKTYGRFDAVIVVYTSPENQRLRLLERDDMTEDLANKIISSQIPIEKKIKYATFIINNDSSIDDLEKEVERIMQDLVIYKYCFKQIKKASRNQ